MSKKARYFAIKESLKHSDCILAGAVVDNRDLKSLGRKAIPVRFWVRALEIIREFGMAPSPSGR